MPDSERFLEAIIAPNLQRFHYEDNIFVWDGFGMYEPKFSNVHHLTFDATLFSTSCLNGTALCQGFPETCHAALRSVPSVSSSPLFSCPEILWSHKFWWTTGQAKKLTIPGIGNWHTLKDLNHLCNGYKHDKNLACQSYVSSLQALQAIYWMRKKYLSFSKSYETDAF